MKLAIMQPYFLPYLGYFQLVEAVDAFVIYDDIKYTKQSWINRNRILVNGTHQFITLPVAQASDSLDIRDRWLVPGFAGYRAKLERKVASAYQPAPHFPEVFAWLLDGLKHPDLNLFKFLHHLLLHTLNRLSIRVPLIISSSLGLPRTLVGQERVIAICQALKATHYINPPGGRALYDHHSFWAAEIKLSFLTPRLVPYQQFKHPFISDLSVLDAMMFNGAEGLAKLLKNYDIAD
jgi:hypothetical protein